MHEDKQIFESKLTLGSLFDGIGGFPLAATRHGITPVWASEIEPSAIAITKRHFPGMVHLGDITKINIDDVPPVDVITFGSPCQDLSIAGRRAGLDGERSGLFHAAIRLIHRLRERDGKPGIIVWENVPGAFSSNNGLDFRAVLEEIAETEIPMPDSGRWTEAGMVRVPSCEIAWRVLDAQYWGVPQRRRRIFLVADFTGRRAAKILFEREGLPGNPAAGGAAGEGTAAGTAGGIAANGKELRTFQTTTRPRNKNEAPTWKDAKVANTLNAFDVGEARAKELVVDSGCLTPWDVQSRRVMSPDGIAPTLSSREGHGGEPGIICLNDQDGNQMSVSEDVCGTLRAQEHGHQPLVLDNAAGFIWRTTGSIGYAEETAPTIETTNKAAVIQNSAGFTYKASAKANGIGYAEECAATLGTDGKNGVCYSIAGNIIGRTEGNGGNGVGAQKELSYTLNTADRHAVCYTEKGCGAVAYGISSFDSNAMKSANPHSGIYEATTSRTLDQSGSNPACNQGGMAVLDKAKCYAGQSYSGHKASDVTSTLKSSGGDCGGGSESVVCARSIIRRLTPLECERLQGFPDNWTEGISDTARYRALGNSVAVPCVEYIMQGISRCCGKRG